MRSTIISVASDILKTSDSILYDCLAPTSYVHMPPNGRYHTTIQLLVHLISNRNFMLCSFVTCFVYEQEYFG